MTKRDTKKPDRTRQRLEKWLAWVLAAYVRGHPDEEYSEASTQLHDLAMFEPETFWYFMEYVATSDIPAEKLHNLGRFGLYWLLRHYPDAYDKRVAALVREDERFRQLIREVDPDRIAPDVWRRMEAALRGEHPTD
jgi:hypothetical protein